MSPALDRTDESDWHDIISSGAGYWVPSLSNPGYYALVDGASCSCKAGAAGSTWCRHRQQVRLLVEERNRVAKRPDAPPNVGALCD